MSINVLAPVPLLAQESEGEPAWLNDPLVREPLKKEIQQKEESLPNDKRRLAQKMPPLPAVQAPSVTVQPVTPAAPAQSVPPLAVQKILQAQGIDTSDSSKQSARPLLKGEITYCIPKGTPLKLKLSMVPKADMKLAQRDEDGNLLPAQLGMPISAKTTEDIYIDDNKVIPAGTTFYGKVSELVAPKRVSRGGWLKIKFDNFLTPDGRHFAFKAEANNFKPSTGKTKLKGLGIIAAHAGGGAALGALVAYSMSGLQQTIAMHGYNVAGAAAIGAIGGITYALLKRGPHAVLEPGDEFQMNIDTDLLIPAASAPVEKKPPVTLPGLEVEIEKTKCYKDGFGGHQLRVEAFFTNRTRHRLKSIDLFLEDENGDRFPVVPDLDEDTEHLFVLEPMTVKKVNFTFQLEYPKLGRKMVWLDHTQRHVLMEQKLP